MGGIVFGEGKERADCMKGCKDGDRSDREGKSGGYGGGIVLRGGKERADCMKGCKDRARAEGRGESATECEGATKTRVQSDQINNNNSKSSHTNSHNACSVHTTSTFGADCLVALDAHGTHTEGSEEKIRRPLGTLIGSGSEVKIQRPLGTQLMDGGSRLRRGAGFPNVSSKNQEKQEIEENEEEDFWEQFKREPLLSVELEEMKKQRTTEKVRKLAELVVKNTYCQTVHSTTKTTQLCCTALLQQLERQRKIQGLLREARSVTQKR